MLWGGKYIYVLLPSVLALESPSHRSLYSTNKNSQPHCTAHGSSNRTQIRDIQHQLTMWTSSETMKVLLMARMIQFLLVSSPVSTIRSFLYCFFFVHHHMMCKNLHVLILSCTAEDESFGALIRYTPAEAAYSDCWPEELPVCDKYGILSSNGGSYSFLVLSGSTNGPGTFAWTSSPVPMRIPTFQTLKEFSFTIESSSLYPSPRLVSSLGSCSGDLGVLRPY